MRRSFARAALALGLIATGSAFGPAAGAQEGRMTVYVGTYTRGGSRGIYQYELDLKTGTLKAQGATPGVKNPSFLAIHPAGKFLYAVSEIADLDGKPSGGVTAFAIDPQTRKLTFLNEQPSRGAGPCHLVVDRQGRNVLVANYGGGSVACLPISSDGRLQAASSFIQHEGYSINKQRQEGPHAHSINLDAAGEFAVAADLGLDKVLVYRFDSEHGKLTPNDPPFTKVKPGSGPRHFAFHTSGRFGYVINEMALTVTAFRYDAERGTLDEFQTISTLPEGVKPSDGNYSTAEVQVHPSGKFLYGSNRVHDTIAIFRIDGQSGRLSPIGHEPTQGRVPRNFGIDPTGTFLLACNQDSDSIVVFRIDPETGRLAATGTKVEVPMPVCVKFLPME